MEEYGISIIAVEGELEEILNELSKAQATIFNCYRKLQSLGVLTITKKETDEGKG